MSNWPIKYTTGSQPTKAKRLNDDKDIKEKKQAKRLKCENQHFLSILAEFSHFPVVKSGPNGQKAHLHIKTFHLSKIPSLSLTFRSNAQPVQAHISKNRCFCIFQQNSAAFRRLNPAETDKKTHLHIKTFHLSLQLVSMTFRSKVLARIRKRCQTDRRPKFFRPSTLGLRPKKDTG